MTDNPVLNTHQEPQSISSSQLRISRRGLFRAAKRSTYGFIGLSLIGGAWGTQVEPEWVEISRYDVELPHLPSAFDGFQVAHITDIHVEFEKSADAVREFCRSIAEMNVDAVLITGDFFTIMPNSASIKQLAEALEPLRAKEGVWGVVGNHDVGHNDPLRGKKSRQAIGEAGVKLLDNNVHIFKRGSDELYLAGVDDLLLGSPDVEGVAAQIPAGSASILMAHEPDFAPEIARVGKFDLMLSGHSHGGQVCMPFIGPILLPDGGKKYPRGWYDFPSESGENKKAMRLYTNRGLGTVGPKVRLFCRPEITIFTLRSQASQQK